jgi:hypothetical protein
MRSGVTTALLAAVAMALPMAASDPSHAAPATCNDVALVLAVDASASISPGEFLLQRQGIAAAFRDASVQQAIAQAGTVVVSAVFWGSEGMAKVQSGWVLVDGPQGAEEFARTVEAMPRKVTGDTGLGSGLVTAIVKLTSPNLCAVRKIINLSGDGEETRTVRGKRRFAPAPMARDMAHNLQVEINALAISNEQPDLAQYYTRNVITGPDAFVMEVRDYAGFADALRRKLIREISPRVVASLPGPLQPSRHLD